MGGALASLLGGAGHRHAAGCPHQLARWVLRTAMSTASYRDVRPGTYQVELRPPERRGGRLVRSVAGCVYAPGHAGEHRTEDGRTW